MVIAEPLQDINSPKFGGSVVFSVMSLPGRNRPCKDPNDLSAKGGGELSLMNLFSYFELFSNR